MDSQDNTLHRQPDAAQPAEQKAAEAPTEPGRFCTFAIVSILMSVIAWITANWNGYVALGTAVVAIVVGFLALRSHRHAVRNTAITSIIASAVLLVVLAAFMIVIYLGLKSL